VFFFDQAGVVVMMLVGLFTIHTMYLLVKCKQKLVSKGIKVITFGDVGMICFGKLGNAIVTILLVFTQVSLYLFLFLSFSFFSLSLSLSLSLYTVYTHEYSLSHSLTHSLSLSTF
jgi:hypothetical protein